jgi:hypothetical protein
VIESLRESNARLEAEVADLTRSSATGTQPGRSVYKRNRDCPSAHLMDVWIRESGLHRRQPCSAQPVDGGLLCGCAAGDTSAAVCSPFLMASFQWHAGEGGLCARRPARKTHPELNRLTALYDVAHRRGDAWGAAGRATGAVGEGAAGGV